MKKITSGNGLREVRRTVFLHLRTSCLRRHALDEERRQPMLDIRLGIGGGWGGWFVGMNNRIGKTVARELGEEPDVRSDVHNRRRDRAHRPQTVVVVEHDIGEIGDEKCLQRSRERGGMSAEDELAGKRRSLHSDKIDSVGPSAEMASGETKHGAQHWDSANSSTGFCIAAICEATDCVWLEEIFRSPLVHVEQTRYTGLLLTATAAAL